ncbi:GIY-YIG nuclease family protein [bacterium]|nr:GIY-YIG nuclease family protein [bacterium]
MKNVRFTNKKQITKKSVENLSKRSAGVYKIVDKNNEVLYVGKAKAGRLGDRIYEHKGRFKDGTNFRIHETGTVEKAERLEKRIIKNEKPPRNRMLKK